MSEAIEWRDVVWKDGLLARIFQPPPGERAARGARSPVAVLDVHGGAWASRDRTLGDRYNQYVAAAGHVVVAIDFRDGRQARHPAASDDIASAVDWLRGRASEFGFDPERLALTGSSSGGQLALHAAMTRVEVCFVAAFWPPVDPLARYRYAKSRLGEPIPEGRPFDPAGLVRSTEAYFGNETAMADASIASLVLEGRARCMPPVWLVEAGDDLNVPKPILDEFVAAYRQAGGVIERTLYSGEEHGFGHGDNENAQRFRRDLVDRLAKA